MEIKVTKDEVYEYVAKVAGYSAKYDATKEDAPQNTFKRTAIFDPYRTLLDDVFDKGADHLTDAVSSVAPFEIHRSWTIEDEETGNKFIVGGYHVKAAMPNNWNDALEDDACRVAKAYLCNHMLSMWMRIIDGEDEDKYFKESQVSILEFSKLLHRKKRLRRREFVELMKERRHIDILRGERLDGYTLQEEHSNIYPKDTES